MAYSVTESMRFKVTDYCVKSKKLPAALSGKRIALLADLHCTHYGKDNSRLFERIRQIAPDIIVIWSTVMTRKSSNMHVLF